MGKRAQVLIIGLWILAILSILAVAVGHRVSMALRLSGYQRDRLKAYALAKAGINRAILELDKDIKDYDSLNETWSTGKDSNENPIFKNIEIIQDSGETFTVKIIDEERKININGLNENLLQQLFILRGYEADAQGLADIIVKWINSEEEEGKGIFKNKPLKVPEELLPILEFYYQEEKKEEEYREKAQEVYTKVKDLITVYGDKKININTVPQENLEILFNFALNQMQEQGASDLPTAAEIQELLNLIFGFREENKYFENIQGIKNNLGLQSIDHKCKIIDFLIAEGIISVAANNFKVESTGSVAKVTKRITIVLTRQDQDTDKKIIYWHEN